MASTNLKFFDYQPSRSATRPQIWETPKLPEFPHARRYLTRNIADTTPNPSRNISGCPLIDFHLFPILPSELQDLIWEHACYSSPNAINMFLRRNMFLFVEDFPTAPTLFLVSRAARDMALRHYLQVDNAVLQRMGAKPEPQQQNPAIIATAAPPANGNFVIPGRPLGTRNNPKPEPLKKFWINPRSDLFLLQIGNMPSTNAQAGNLAVNQMMNGLAINAPLAVPPPANPLSGTIRHYDYPFSSIAHYSAELATTKKPAWRRVDELNLYQKSYRPPPSFPTTGRLPRIFSLIHHLVLNLTLPPFLDDSSTTAYSTAAENVIQAFMRDVVENTLPHFPKLRQVDFYVSSAAGVSGQKASLDTVIEALLGCDQMTSSFGNLSLDGKRYYIKDYRQAPVIDSDGVSFGSVELGLLEREFTIAFLDKARREGKRPHEALNNYIVVAVPWYVGRMDYGLDSGKVVDNTVGFEMRDTAAVLADDEGIDMREVCKDGGGLIDEKINGLVAGLTADDKEKMVDEELFDGAESEDDGEDMDEDD